MSDKFTPGPWIAATHGLSVHRVTPEGLTGSAVCMLMTKSGAINNHEANARLIAAAPAMYEALEQIDNWLVCWAIATPEDMAQSFQHMQQVASAALALARGEA